MVVIISCGYCSGGVERARLPVLPSAFVAVLRGGAQARPPCWSACPCVSAASRGRCTWMAVPWPAATSTS